MHVISQSEDRTTRTPAGTMIALAGPSQGSQELSTWRVEMEPDATSPVHLIDQDQVWMPVSGVFSFTVAGESADVAAGQALVVPAGVVRQFRAPGGPAAALVAMRSGGQAGTPDSDAKIPLPWAR